MNIIGTVAEYNPFHYGHLHHINETKKLFPDCAVVCAMSGDFVQRGEPALFDKFTRAEAACMSGVDLVLELPVTASLSSAEGFARAGVRLLDCAGAEYLSFGSESGDTGILEKAAELLNEPEIIEQIKQKMRRERELSFAAARQLVLSEHSAGLTEAVVHPNNILGVEYIKAIKSFKINMKPLTVKRRGSAHDSFTGEEFPSATEIRCRFYAGEDIRAYIPETAYRVYADAIKKGRVIDKKMLAVAVLSRLRMADREYFNSIPDASDGLGDRIYKASREARSLEELYETAKTKKYAMSRVRRICMCAAAGITANEIADDVPYIRVLAANKTGCAILKSMGERAVPPVITKPSSVYKYDEQCRKMFAHGASANDLFVLGYREEATGYGGQDWKTSPKIVENR